MIRSLLIANRGEIACRVIRTARRMGIRTVAVYSDADAKALHVRQADEAVHIGPSPARDSYLRGDRVIEAARATGAEAIHPGYGFLSENADFAQAVIDAGLVWVGPEPASIRAMGLKDAAKTLMMEAGVPTTPGYLGEDQSPERLQAEADAIGYPVLIKAVAGGGGKGMRRVENAAEFADALQSCRREAASSFGDDRVLLEKYILSPRHIEVQVFGDSFGQVVHLFERDCSLQRRHQKVIEEAPAPGMDEATREAVCGAAVTAARAVDYQGAGTIEFIADASEGLRADRIWFMEMNTRLQVEHPVTEEITGVDLVEWQLRVASGERLPKRQDELSINGWAMEARLYAEDPLTGFLPSTGKLQHLQYGRQHYALVMPLDERPPLWPDMPRLETGVEEGSAVSPFYDPMIAKLVCPAPTRDEAAAALADWCADVEVWPVRTNAAFLSRLLREPAFVAGEVNTGYIDAHVAELTRPEPPSDAMVSAATHLYLNAYVVSGYDALSSAGGLDGFRLNAPPRHTAVVIVDGSPREVSLLADDGEDSDAAPLEKLLVLNGGVVMFANGGASVLTHGRWSAGAAGTAADGAILSPMPGRIIAVEVAAGERVAKGQKLVTLEAMKMEHSLVAPFDGTVAELDATAGAQVSEGKLLARVERES